MPIKDHIQNVNAFICERMLFEQDNVLSAIRFVDIFFVPEDASPDFKSAFTFVVVMKFKFGYVPPDKIPMRVTLIRSNGEREVMGDQALQIPTKDIPGPVGVGLILQVQLVPRNFGTAYLEASVGDEIIATVPFTLVKQQRTQPVQP